jgi:tRNA threonylcarbamoyladenosine biosynthesis protein TsaE
MVILEMMDYKVTIRNEEEMMELAQNIESEKFPNMIICLDGELGSGKTVFVKGFAQALGITEVITSPTFNIVKEYYGGELPLFHMDVYRLKSGCHKFGFRDYYAKGGISIIEWSELISDCLPEERLDIEFKIIDENTRVLKFKPHGKEYEDLCNSVL